MIALSEDFTIKKSTFNKLLGGIMVACIAAAFLGGYTVGQYGDVTTTVNQQAQSPSNANQPPTQPTQQPQQGSGMIQNVSIDDDPVKGNDNAKITIIEFSDFQCPFCERFATQTFSQLMTEYVDSGKAKFVYRDFPLDDLHPNARAAALAAECAHSQGKFWEYHEKLFSQQGEWERLNSTAVSTAFVGMASGLNLDKSSFNTCLESKKYSDEVKNDYSQGTRYGVTGTPTFFIGNSNDGFVKVVGSKPIQSFRDVIDPLLTQ